MLSDFTEPYIRNRTLHNHSQNVALLHQKTANAEVPQNSCSKYQNLEKQIPQFQVNFDPPSKQTDHATSVASQP